MIATISQSLKPAVLIVAFCTLTACTGPRVLARSVIQYDETTAVLEQKLLLVNIARRNLGYPVHFTVTGSIAATFDWTKSAGLTGDISTGGFNDLLSLRLETSGSENPTFSIFPISGEEFTQRILTPIPEEVFQTVAFQGSRLDATLRLIADGIEVQDEYGGFVRMIANDPSRPEEYEEFRQLMMHMQWLYHTRRLFIRTLQFEEILLEDFLDTPDPQDINEAFLNGLTWRPLDDGGYALTRRGAGRLVITNYDPNTLSDYERWELNDRIRTLPPSFVFFDLHPDYPGGEMDMQGAITLRSLQRILDFVATGLEEAPEFDVQPDPRTAQVDINPRSILDVRVTDEQPPGDILSVRYGGKYYSIARTDWDLSTFREMSWLFQATVSEVRSPGIPITIAK